MVKQRRGVLALELSVGQSARSRASPDAPAFSKLLGAVHGERHTEAGALYRA